MSDRRASESVQHGIRVGRVGRVPVFLRPSWFLIAVLMAFVFAPVIRDRVIVPPGAEYVIGIGFALILLVSVLVHELTHAAAAAISGTPATHIVLDLWGGHTTFTERSSRPLPSLAISAVGPLSNLGIFVLVRSLDLGGPFSVTALLVAFTATANLLLAAFNALPGLPLDGGGVLEALVWLGTGDRHRGTVVAGWTGRLGALAIAAWTVVQLITGTSSPTSAVWLLLAAGLLWQGAGAAIVGADWLRRADRAHAGDLLQPAVAVTSTASLAAAVSAATEAGAHAVVVLDVYGRPSAIMDEQAAADVPADRTEQVWASAVAHAIPEGAVLPAGLGGEALLRRLQDSPATRYAVVDPQQQVVGVLDWEDVARFLGRG
jgi:Zn-dependent protease